MGGGRITRASASCGVSTLAGQRRRPPATAPPARCTQVPWCGSNTLSLHTSGGLLIIEPCVPTQALRACVRCGTPQRGTSAAWDLRGVISMRNWDSAARPHTAPVLQPDLATKLQSLCGQVTTQFLFCAAR